MTPTVDNMLKRQLKLLVSQKHLNKIKGTLSNSVDGPWNSILKVEFFFYTLIASLKCWGVWLGP
ncbi:MAG TPA: hypothetical protein H9869_02125, partial [Candidatus Ligilactobacillus excrementipullorum]|nr:hypothetical protein [Candidatus Ligilactobacillus excrementipullorum]